MAQTKKVSQYPSISVVGAPNLATSASSLLQGVFVGLDANGKIKPADYRASAGPVVARGVMLQDAQLKDPRGNVLDTVVQGSFTYLGRVKGITDRNGAALTPGATYYLHSGGGISATKPATTTSDVDQEVGYAVSADELQLALGQEVIHA